MAHTAKIVSEIAQAYEIATTRLARAMRVTELMHISEPGIGKRSYETLLQHYLLRIAVMTKFRPWKISELVDALTGKGDKKIIIPSFQRSFVWSKEQRLLLIESIRLGFPVGSLLLFHNGYAEGKERLHLVDGLQRTITLHKYHEELFQHTTVADLLFESTDSAFAMCVQNSSRDDFETCLVSWLRTRTSFSAAQGYTNIELWMRLREDGFYLESSPSPAIMISLQQVLDAVKRRLDISSYEMPVIEYMGSPEDLPAIFERLNTGGIKLAKYDILAASWNDQLVSIESPEIVEAIKSKYRELEMLGLEFDTTANDHYEKYDASYEYLIFEFVFAAGRCLKSQFPKLYGRLSEASTEVDSIGFTLVTLCSGLRIVQLGDFADVIKRFKTADIYYAKLVDASIFVQDSLSFILKFPLDKESPRKLPHSEFQIAALALRVYNE